ncbi:hypothetical protein D9611_005370 [Ephemerocybe angulata]|uniref:F-box domain-containing protein n=1 Tax=Ephemerocybe angulata TaxID=980116 RepID=A0A8H5FDT2_9AGAR|nr:hypothetical protein D9611_005370 [Tulosesus angulatus]
MFDSVSPDIIPLILQNLDRKSLLAAILTERRFAEPGLNQLWRDIDSFQPLVSCLPGDLFIVRPFPGGRLYDLKRPVELSDFRRYRDQYAFRIRTLRVNYAAATMKMTGELLLALHFATSHIPGALFPRLREVRWASPGGSVSSHLPLFLPPTLSSLLFYGPQGPLQETSLHVIAQRVTSLQSLCISSPDANPLFIEKFITKSLQGHNLQKLEMPYASMVTLQHLSTLPQLEAMHLFEQFSLPCIYPPGEPPILPTEDRFPALKALEIRAERLSDLLGIIQFFPPRNCLQSLSIDTDELATFTEIQDVISTIALHLNPSTFQNLNLVTNTNRDGYNEPLDRTPDELVDISPLFRFGLLRTCRLELPSHDISFSQDHITQMATSWTRMEALILQEAVSTRTPTLDHRGIVELLAGMPALREVCLRFDASRIQGNETPTFAPHGLSSMTICQSPIQSPSRVAQFLAAHCPSLRKLPRAYVEHKYAAPLVMDRWIEVARLLALR